MTSLSNDQTSDRHLFWDHRRRIEKGKDHKVKKRNRVMIGFFFFFLDLSIAFLLGKLNPLKLLKKEKPVK